MADYTVFICGACRQEKPLSEFRPDQRLKRGHWSTCRECKNIQGRKKAALTKQSKCTVILCDRGQLACGLCGMHYARWKKTGQTGEASPRVHFDPAEKPECIERGCKKQTYCNRRCEEHYRQFKWKAAGKCVIDGCDSTAITRKFGLCRMHDARRRRWGDPLACAPGRTGEGVTCSIMDCGDVVIAKGLCAKHYQRWYAHGDPNHEPDVWPVGSRKPYRDGYWMIKAPGHAEARLSGGWAVEHRKVMSDMLGRKLRPNETPHHLNGNRSDNRPENLELWVIAQPAGQRPADLVKWAKEILFLYEDEVEAQARAQAVPPRDSQGTGTSEQTAGPSAGEQIH